jgi:hypothetical protein
MNEYYVYTFKRPDINKYFYVGYGIGKRRYFKTTHRSKEVIQIVNDLREKGLQPTTHIIVNNLSKTDAKEMEYYLIRKLLKEGHPLVNKYLNFHQTWLKHRKGI